VTKKILLLFFVGILCLSVRGPVWAEGENDFWLACSQGDYGKAGNIAKELSANNPAYYALAAICYQNGSEYEQFRIYHNKFQKLSTPDNLKALFAERQTINPDDPQLLLLQGSAAIILPEVGLGDPGPLLQKAAAKLGDNPYLNNYQALNEINKHNYSPVVQKGLQKAIALKKNYPEPYINLALVLAQNKETDKAISLLLDCFNNCPRLPNTAYQNLINLVSSPVPGTIRPYGQQMTVLVPNIKEIYRVKVKTSLSKTPEQLETLAEIFATKGNTALARYLISGIVSTDNSLVSYVQLQIANYEGNFEQAVQISDTLSDNNNLTYARIYEIGNVLFYGKEFKSAIAFYEEALKMMNPDDDEFLTKVYTNLGICYYLDQEYQDALGCFEKVLSMNPQDVNSLIYSGLAYRDLGDKDKALAYLTQALNYIPDADWHQEITNIVNQLKPQ